MQNYDFSHQHLYDHNSLTICCYTYIQVCGLLNFFTTFLTKSIVFPSVLELFFILPSHTRTHTSRNKANSHRIWLVAHAYLKLVVFTPGRCGTSPPMSHCHVSPRVHVKVSHYSLTFEIRGQPCSSIKAPFKPTGDVRAMFF